MITFNTFEQYQTAKYKLDQYEAAAKKWTTDNKTNGIPVETTNTFPYAAEVNNDMRSAVETYEFIGNPPEKYFLYINEEKRIATTWTGQQLGTLVFGREYTATFGDKRQSITVNAINGKTYYGTYYKSSGDYARIKAKK